MRKIQYILFILLLMFAFNVKADDTCDKNELARLKELAKKVEFDYDYKLENDEAVFSINAVNLSEDLKVLIIDDYYNAVYREFKNSDTHQATLDGFSPGEKVVITIKGFVANWCSGKTVLTKTVKIPYYNYYYDEEKCRGNEDFKYCKILIDKKITQNEFDRQLELFLKNKEEKSESVPAPKKDNTDIYIVIGAGVLLVIIVIMLIRSIINRRKKNRL